MFGVDPSTSVQRFYEWSLKSRLDEDDAGPRQDAGELNEIARQKYQKEVADLLQELNRPILGRAAFAGFTVTGVATARPCWVGCAYFHSSSPSSGLIPITWGMAYGPGPTFSETVVPNYILAPTSPAQIWI